MPVGWNTGWMEHKQGSSVAWGRVELSCGLEQTGPADGPRGSWARFAAMMHFFALRRVIKTTPCSRHWDAT